MSFLKNVKCPECESIGTVSKDGDFYNCNECNHFWGIDVSKSKKDDRKKAIEISKNTLIQAEKERLEIDKDNNDNKVEIELELDEQTINYIKEAALVNKCTIDEVIEEALKKFIEEYR